MGMQLRAICYHIHQNSSLIPPTSLTSLPSFSPAISSLSKTHFVQNNVVVLERCLGFYRSDGSSIISSIGGIKGRRRVEHGVVATSSNVAASFCDDWKPGKRSAAPSHSDVLWPSAEAFAEMDSVSHAVNGFCRPANLGFTGAKLSASSVLDGQLH
ncbi:hypothetical protein FH972_005086 [Carpinus fangiana]|uniref:Uncharacterized protein n=1 Tax=Carpinus fangiana TaxID=176857 RepID=A0A5N6QRG9_9ROSI|nr:hypothetical protein FH972_005086 [Carpinus fangiana]